MPDVGRRRWIALFVVIDDEFGGIVRAGRKRMYRQFAEVAPEAL
jgi:hypothetical protein